MRGSAHLLGRRVDRNLLVFGCVGHGLWRHTRARLRTTRSFVGRRSYVYLLIHHNTAAVVAGRIYTCMPLLLALSRSGVGVGRAGCVAPHLHSRFAAATLCVPGGAAACSLQAQYRSVDPCLVDVFVPLYR